MRTPAKTIYWFSWFWILPNGLILVAAPDGILGLLGMETAGSMWLRIMGMLIVILSYYYIRLSRQGNTDFFRWTVQTRGLVPLVFVGFWLLGMPPVVILFALGDFLGAIATAIALHHEGLLFPKNT